MTETVTLKDQVNDHTPIYSQLDPEFKEEWLEKLTNGEYYRTTGRLRRPTATFEGKVITGHCCLGVVTQMAIDKGIRKSKFPEMYEGYATTKAQRDKGVFLQPSIAKWAKINEFTQKKLAEINDEQEEEEGKFIKIVEFIKENM